MLTFSINPTTEQLFSEFAEMDCKQPKTDLQREWFSEAYIGVIEGRAEKDTNLGAYAYQCEQNTKMAKKAREVNLINDNESKDYTKGSMLENYVLSSRDFADGVPYILESEYVDVINAFNKLNNGFQLIDGICLSLLISSALRGNKDSIEKLRVLIEQEIQLKVLDYKFADFVRYIIENVAGLNAKHKELFGYALIETYGR